MPKKNTTGKVPATKVEKLKTIKLTKSMKELFIARQVEANDSLKIIVAEFNKQHGLVLSKLVDDFILELKIDVENEEWAFDAKTMSFTRKVKK